jgi:hypothetical protein
MLLFLCSCLFLFLKLYFSLSWTLAFILTVVVLIVYVILDGLVSFGKYLILFLIAIGIVYYIIHLF